MNKVEPMNGFVFVQPIRETKKAGGLDLISKYDEVDRYSKAEVVFVDKDLPLKCCDIIMYDKSNGHGFQFNKDLLTVLHIRDIVGVYEED